MIDSVYVKIQIADITEDILDKAVSKNVASLRKTTNGVYTILEFSGDAVPADILVYGYTLLTKEQAISELNSGSWN